MNDTDPAPQALRAAPRERHLPPLGLVLAVAAGGALGGVLRFWLLGRFPPQPGAIPWVILAENVSGAFLLGLILPLLLKLRAPEAVRAFLTTGVLGSYTTFSNLAVALVVLQGSGALGLALGYGFGSLLLGVAAAALGFRCALALARA